MNNKIVLLLLLVSAVVFIPVLASLGNWGLYDWDQHFFYNEAARTAILDYGQFPLWNAHYCGGTPLLANPQSGFLSPFFLFVLLFGAVAGLKLQALFYMILGLLGTFLAARKLGSSSVSSALAAVIFMLSSWFAARVVVGHTTFFPFALLPWAFYFYLKSLAAWKWLMAAAAVLAVMFLSGGLYALYASVLLLASHSALTAAEKRQLRPLLLAAAIFIVFLGLAAVKLLPMIELVSDIPPPEDVQLTGFGMAARALFHPFQGIAENDLRLNPGLVTGAAMLRGEIPWGWHEYSAYVGVISFLLAVISAVNYRRNWKLQLIAAFFFLLSLGHLLPLWPLLRNLPFFSALHGPSRFIIPFTFMIALLAAQSLTSLRLPRKQLISCLLLAVVAAELLFVSLPLFSSAFPLTPQAGLQTGNPDFIQYYAADPYVSQFPNLLQNLGTVNCWERIHLAPRAAPQFIIDRPNPAFIGNAYIAETNQSFDFDYFSPNNIRVNLESAIINDTAVLVINQNYYAGWKSSNNKAKSFGGLLAAEITAADKKIEFYYLPRSFVLGAVISFATAAILLLLLLKPGLIRNALFQPQS
ncbi:hypothetical protein HYX10_04475 [Candidatus Woesearchaeota archaeon]|nr:hypothetical protein [Candidatus Woesearchaeota archaeon]